LPDSDSWSVDLVNKIIGTPWCPKGRGPGSDEDMPVEVIPAGSPLEAGHPRPRKTREEGAPRDLYIKMEHIVKFGHTASCLKCRAMREGFQVTKGPSSICRDRIMEALKGDDDYQQTLEQIEERKQSYLARAIEDSDREANKRKIEESRLASTTATSSSSSTSTSNNNSSSPSSAAAEKRKQNEAAVSPAKQPKVVTFEAPESRKCDRDGDEEEEEDRATTHYQALALMNKAKYQELMKAKREQAENIMQKDPNSGKFWNVCSKKSREAAVEFIHRIKPKMLHLELFEGLKTEIALSLAEIQRHAGRKFVLEGPIQSSSWNVPAARKLLKMQETHQAVVDSHVEGGPKVRIMTNDEVTASTLRSTRCCRRTSSQKMMVTLAIEESMDIHAEAALDKHYEHEEKDLRIVDELAGVYIDDVSGECLDSKQVKVARQIELKTFEEMEVFQYVRRSDISREGKLVGTRWLDSCKNGKMKGRLVAQEFAKGSNRDDIFAGTPPLMASRLVLSDTASRSKTGITSRRLAILDVKRAFLHGIMEEEVYIELPDEDDMKQLGYVGILLKAMYGTRSAPLMWQKVVKKTMRNVGFHACITTPCMYHHESKDLFVVAHVDDFLCSGEMRDLQWMKAELEKQFELTGKFIGPGQEGDYLGRKIRWGHSGISFEGENKYIDLMAMEWDLLHQTVLNAR
jgi:hypothetical protein